jgi:Protein of unknown function (DUF3433)
MAWRTGKLHPPALTSLLLVEIGIVAALSVLYSLSQREHGFVPVKQIVPVSFSAGTESLHSSWNISFLWTSLPSLFMVLFNLSWTAVIDGLAEETPMRDLAGQNGASLEKTVLLDYRRHLSFFRWIVAFKNGHCFLGSCMLLSVINAIILVPFAAHLFSAIPVKDTKKTTFSLLTTYNASADIALIDYAPILATVTAVRTQGGQWPNGTDGTYAFPNFTTQADVYTQNVSQWALNVTGYTASLACVTVSAYDISTVPAQDGVATIAITATDRGCNISLKGGIGPGPSVFLKTNSIIDCSAESGLSRISFFAGTYAATAPYLLNDMNVVSCRPSYSQISGTLTAPPSLQPLSFNPTNQSYDARPANWRGFEQDMLSLSNIGNPDSHDFTSGFGELLLEYARTQDASSSLAPDLLASSASTVFSSIFAVFAESFLFAPVSNDMTVSGLSIISETRLTVVAWSTLTSIGILSVLIILTVILFFYLWRFEAVLPEEPHGILGYASLLHGSDLNNLLDDANQGCAYEGKFYEWLRAHYVLGSERCSITQKGEGPNKVITVEQLEWIVRVAPPPVVQNQPEA